MTIEKETAELLKALGALRVGFANLETLAGGPPSADLRYILPGARSAVSFALPEKKEFVKSFLEKKDNLSHEKDHLRTTLESGKISEKVKSFLEAKGYRSASTHGSGVYRRDVPGWKVEMYPDISHRYVAVRSGVGSFGWSGNVGIKGYGAAILLGTVVTEADIEPTEPLPESESFCIRCKLCAASCVGEDLQRGGGDIRHPRRQDVHICEKTQLPHMSHRGRGTNRIARERAMVHVVPGQVQGAGR